MTVEKNSIKKNSTQDSRVEFHFVSSFNSIPFRVKKMSDEVDEQWKEKDNILFYGVYVNTFSLAIAANSYRSTSKFQDFLQKIQKLKQDGILQTQEGTSAIHKIPIEVWSQIELLVIQDALEVSKKELCELAWGNCEDPLREDRVPREGENYTTHACTPSNVYIWVCGECRKAGVEFWKDDVYEKFVSFQVIIQNEPYH